MTFPIHLLRALCWLSPLTFVIPAHAGALTWQVQEVVAADGAAHDALGRGAAVLGDVAFVGATNAPGGGAVYVLTRGADGQWRQTQKLTAIAAPDGSDFGGAIALGAQTAVIGAARTTLTDDGNRHQGAAYVFTRGSDGQWTQLQKLTASDFGAEAQFGNAVALSGSTVLIGAFNTMVGANAFQGAAYVFTLDAGTWSETRRIIADDGAGGDDFGYAVALDGQRALIGALYGSGAAAQYGAAYVFDGSGSAWTQTAKLFANDGAFFDSFGTAVALSGDDALITSPFAQVGDNSGQGAAYAFHFTAGAWSQTQKLAATEGLASDSMGNALVIDGDRALIGASSANGYTGAAYAFERDAAGWNELGMLVATDAQSGDGFGYTVALSGDTFLTGVPLKMLGANETQGAAYFFTQPRADAIFDDGFDTVVP